MSLPTNKPPFGDIFLAEGTTSIATSPVPALIASPVNGFLTKLFATVGGSTTGTIAVAVSINGGPDITGGLFTIPAGNNARNGATLDLAKVGLKIAQVNEGDAITFTPSGGTGASIPGGFSVGVRPQ